MYFKVNCENPIVMIIRLNYKFIICFFTLTFVMHELHEIVPTASRNGLYVALWAKEISILGNFVRVATPTHMLGHQL